MARKTTDIEQLMSDTLLDMGLRFKREFYIGNYPVDFYLPEYNLSIQTDGCWCHGHLGCKLLEGNKKKYPRQLFQARRDKACNLYHKHSKVNIIRVRECSLKSDVGKFKKDLKTILKLIKQGSLITQTL
jgi:G:T-mismatch repair DNA endonuclease (very short patch repair protein)